MKNFILAYIAILIFALLEPFSFVYVVIIKRKSASGYWRSLAYDVDRFGNHQYRTLFNRLFVKENGYQFGDFRETVSSVLGKNYIKGTLTKSGRILVWILDKIDKNHVTKSIHEL